MFKRKESLNFYALLIQQAQVIRDAVAALCAFCEDPTQEKGDFVKVKEKEADTIRRQLVEDINRTFITPIDRDDLYRLSTSIDDLADYAWTTVKEVRIYDIQPDEHLLAMSRTLLQMADGLLICMQKLEKDHAGVAAEATKVKKLENALNVQFHQSIAELFETDDIKKILKYREIYSHMNHAADKGDFSADILLDIVVKL
ncbi:DUF47 family protein [Oscillibacter valericigenes]|uniref:DUF47 domain-containing protein n=1 Tax=Oscillibacter valericigenes TaxID=351091 RepID=UPI001F42755C|nr:DUF47 family protein [Oscillibacter valericigenes]MCF2665142.1 DUF47 family protein [Oscillibacter valericigenes]